MQTTAMLLTAAWERDDREARHRGARRQHDLDRLTHVYRRFTADRAKFFGLLFGIAISTLLITQQLIIFLNLLGRGGSGG